MKFQIGDRVRWHSHNRYKSGQVVFEVPANSIPADDNLRMLHRKFGVQPTGQFSQFRDHDSYLVVGKISAWYNGGSPARLYWPNVNALRTIKSSIRDVPATAAPMLEVIDANEDDAAVVHALADAYEEVGNQRMADGIRSVRTLGYKPSRLSGHSYGDRQGWIWCWSHHQGADLFADNEVDDGVFSRLHGDLGNSKNVIYTCRSDAFLDLADALTT